MAIGIHRAKFIILNTYVRNKDRKSVSWAVNSGSWGGRNKTEKSQRKNKRNNEIENKETKEGPQTQNWVF